MRSSDSDDDESLFQREGPIHRTHARRARAAAVFDAPTEAFTNPCDVTRSLSLSAHALSRRSSSSFRRRRRRSRVMLASSSSSVQVNHAARVRRSSRRAASVASRRVVAAAAADRQELCKAEIPPHIPRADFVKQMYRWCSSEYEQGGLSAYGKRMSVECINELADGDTNGVLVRIYDFKDGKEVEIGQLIAQMDDEKVQTWDTIVPTKEGGIEKLNRDGKDHFIEGRFFVISRPLPADESSNPALKKMIKRLTLAINAYYSFGSPFSEDF